MRRFRLFILFVAVSSIRIAMTPGTVAAQTQSAEAPPAGPGTVVIVPQTGLHRAAVPTHLSIGNQQFDASVGGLRAYLETIKTTNTPLYMQLAPHLERLESRTTSARIAVAVGLGVGLASTAYAFIGRNDCVSPSINDPAFSTSVAAWDACNKDNLRTITTFALIGIGSILASGVAWWAIAPDRDDLFDFVNEHNRSSHEPLHFQLGYDPARRLAYGGTAFSF